MNTWFLAVVAFLVAAQTVGAVPVIQAPWGTIQGVEVAGDGARRMNGYLGIPYALPPVGELRFEKPQPHPGPGEGKVFVADTFLPACMQLKPFLISAKKEISEDCLMLSVFVPTGAQNSNALYPVMFFIHGGGLSMGDAPYYRPSKLVVDGQVIVVTIQYRLGSFGFISTLDDVLPGNQGLWDQNLALRWVKDNIRAFGGDPDLITVFGESAGSWSTGLQMFSPQSKGLMKRAILQSGAPQSAGFLTEFYRKSNVFGWVAGLFDCKRDTSIEIVQCLKKVPAADFLNKTMNVDMSSPAGSYFFAIIDGEFIPRDMKELAQDEQFVQENGISDIDVMMGVNNQEGALGWMGLVGRGLSIETLKTPEFFRGIRDTCLIYLSESSNDILKKTVEFMYRGADADTNNSVSFSTLGDMYGDCLMMAPILEWTHLLAAAPHTARRYLYVLDHDFSFNNDCPYPGSHHADELMFEFDNEQDFDEDYFFVKLNKTKPLTPEEIPIAEKFVQIVTTFAKTGNPSGPLKDDLDGGEWPEFTPEEEAYLSIAAKPRIIFHAGPYRDRAALWNKLLPKLHALTSQTMTQSEDRNLGKDEL